jgi:ATP-binding protein involved in chromosome partitioning
VADQVPEFEDVEEVCARAHAALARVERIVAVMSGKGGVGKSAVAVNLAAALGLSGRRTGLLDADLHGPSVAQMLGLRGEPVRIGTDERLRPIAGPAGLAVQSMDFFLQGNQALDWEGTDAAGATDLGGGPPSAGLRPAARLLRSLAGGALEQAALVDLLGRTAWGELDCLVIDLAPGADRLPALAPFLTDRAVALAVAIPTEVALLAVERSLRRAFEARVPVLGLVENFASAVCGTCGAEMALFREADPAARFAAMRVEVIARVPFDPALARAADAGRPYVAGPGASTPAGRALAALADRILCYPGAPEDAR